jgi:hypothetical protein
MRRRICFVVFIVLATIPCTASADSALSEYREALAESHGPLVAVPTYIGATVGAVALTPLSLLYGTASLVLFRDNPARVAESWLTAPKRGWYWGGMVLGTPFRALKAVFWDAPKAVFRLFRRSRPPPPE